MQGNAGWEQLKLLFDYTKFHIGLYATLASALIALVNTDFGKRLSLNGAFVWAAVLFIASAGLAGGVVASSLPWFESIQAFRTTAIGPFRTELMRGELWTYVEHTSFWLGIVSILIAFGWRSPV